MSDFGEPSLDNWVDAVNSSNLNGFILEAFLCGLYCVVFAHAAWRLFHQKNWILVTFLTIQWISAIIVLAMDWFIINVAYLRRGDTATDIAQALWYQSYYAGRVPAVDLAFFTISILLCNGFLIWHFHVLCGKTVALTVILSAAFVASIVLGFIRAFPTTKMLNDTYGTLPASISVAFFATSAVIALILSSLMVRWTTRGKRLTPKSFLLALVDGAVPFSQIMFFLTFLAVVSLPSVFRSGAVKQLLVDELNAYLGFPLPPLAGLTTTLICLRVLYAARNSSTVPELSGPAYSEMTFTRTILVPKSQE